jgi:anti-anti-sigma factor
MADTPATLLEEQDDVVVVRVQVGDLDENHIKAVQAELAAASATRKQPFVVDLAKVKFIPSLTLGILVRIANEFRSRGQRLTLAALQPGVRQMLAITQLHRLFDIQDSVDGAITEIRMK